MASLYDCRGGEEAGMAVGRVIYVKYIVKYIDFSIKQGIVIFLRKVSPFQ